MFCITRENSIYVDASRWAQNFECRLCKFFAVRESSYFDPSNKFCAACSQAQGISVAKKILICVNKKFMKEKPEMSEIS